MLGLVSSFDQAWLREPLRYLVAVSALALLVIACNAAMFGLSRLGYSLALNRQIPSLLGRLHPRFDTPFVLIALGALLAIALVLPADLELLAAIYAFGATLAFTLVHLSVIRLRFREPERDRPYRIPFDIRDRRRGAARLGAARRAAVGRRVRVRALPARRRPLRRRRLAAVRRRALRRRTGPSRASRSSSASASRPRRSPGARSRRSSARSSCPCSARRSTTTSCRPRGGSPARRTRTPARAAR